MYPLHCGLGMVGHLVKDFFVKDEIRIEISSSNLSLSFTFAEVETLM